MRIAIIHSLTDSQEHLVTKLSQKIREIGSIPVILINDVTDYDFAFIVGIQAGKSFIEVMERYRELKEKKKPFIVLAEKGSVVAEKVAVDCPPNQFYLFEMDKIETILSVIRGAIFKKGLGVAFNFSISYSELILLNISRVFLTSLKELNEKPTIQSPMFTATNKPFKFKTDPFGIFKTETEINDIYKEALVGIRAICVKDFTKKKKLKLIMGCLDKAKKSVGENQIQ